MDTSSHLYSCPVCKQPLALEEKSYKCEIGHCFDIAKEGYVNLLVANKKNSKNPGDTKEAVTARRNFLEKGYFEPLVEGIKTMIEDLGPEGITLLDSCCGEGYYTSRIAGEEALQISDCHGYDVSKPAIIAAAKKYKNVEFSVAKVSNIPLTSATVDIVMTIFSPLSSSEFYRVLKEEGFVLVVSAGADHLKELASMVYDEFKPHKYHPSTHLERYFSLVEEKEVKYDKTVDNRADILSLLKMTPYFWNTKKDKLDKIAALDALELTCDFRLSLFMKNDLSEEEE